MRFFRPIIFLSALAGVTAVSVRAAAPALTAEVDRQTITLNDTVVLRLSLSGGRLSVSPPVLPEVPGFRVAPAGQSQNISFVNGSVSQQAVFLYALTPQAPGEFTIPAISLTVAGTALTTEPIAVKVLPGTAAPVGAEDGQGGAPGRDLFVTTTVDKKTVRVGEPVTLLFRFYSRAPLLSQPRYEPPDTTGFLTEDLPPQRQYVTVLNGRRYQVVELATALFPSAPGPFTIGPAALECNVQDFSRGADDPFSSFFGGLFAQSQTVVLRSDPVTVHVQPLPAAGRPASFQGDVGDYRLSAALDKATARVHEPVTLTVTVSGTGHIKSLSSPALPDIPGFKIYETLSSLNIEKKDRRVQGSRVFTTVLKPEASGTLTVPPLAFSFFDPAAGAYKTVRTGKLSLTVTPGETPAETASPGSPSPPGEGVREIAQDIRFIKTNGALTLPGAPLLDRGWFRAVLFFPGLFFLFLWAGMGLKERAMARPWGSSSRRARKRAEKDVARARALVGRDLAAHRETLHRVFLEYLGATLGARPQGLTVERVRRGLADRAVPPETAQEVEDLLADFERARYTPALLTAPEEEACAARVLELLRLLDGRS